MVGKGVAFSCLTRGQIGVYSNRAMAIYVQDLFFKEIYNWEVYIQRDKGIDLPIIDVFEDRSNL